MKNLYNVSHNGHVVGGYSIAWAYSTAGAKAVTHRMLLAKYSYVTWEIYGAVLIKEGFIDEDDTGAILIYDGNL